VRTTSTLGSDIFCDLLPRTPYAGLSISSLNRNYDGDPAKPGTAVGLVDI
jgi:hypothetical protein